MHSDDPIKQDDAETPDRVDDPREAETVDPHSGMSDDPRVDPTQDRRQSEG